MATSTDVGAKSRVTVRFQNEAGVDVSLRWVTFAGAESEPIAILPNQVIAQDTFPGHTFRIRTVGAETLLKTYTVPSDYKGTVKIKACDGMDADAEEKRRARWPEFEALVHDASTPCVGPSRNWSCIRYVSPEEVSKRDKTLYGYHADELGSTSYQVGQTVDHLFGWQAGYIVNVTEYEGGYLKMEMTDRMKKILYPWIHERKRDSMVRHQDIPGGFTNNHVAFFDIIQLGAFPEIKSQIIQEMRDVLEWWTKMKLRHSETFGVRIYRRNAMLVDHLDRQETHVASAVLQVTQKVDEDGGWPLEVIHPHKPGRKEVYLQPGQMILYEGARITHGRPMRFRGKEFANIFSHFVPITWSGLDRSKMNPHFHPDKAAAHGSEL